MGAKKQPTINLKGSIVLGCSPFTYSSAPVAIPMTEVKLTKAPEAYKCNEKELKAYQTLLGELMHLMVQTRPDLA